MQNEQYEYLNQKYLELRETYRRETEKAKNIIYVMIFVAAVLFVVVVNLFIFYRRGEQEEEDVLDEKPKQIKRKKTKKEIEVFDFNDED